MCGCPQSWPGRLAPSLRCARRRRYHGVAALVQVGRSGRTRARCRAIRRLRHVRHSVRRKDPGLGVEIEGTFGIGFHCCLDVQRVTQDDHGAQQGRLARIQAVRILRRLRPVDADIQRLAEACDRRQRQACDQVGERRLLVLCRILGLNRGSRNPRPSGMTLSPMPTPPNCGPAGSTRVVRADVVGWWQAGSSSVLGSLEDPA